MRSIHIRRAVLLGYVSGALALCAAAGVPLNAAPTAAPGANGPSGIMDDSDGKERRSPVNTPVRTENAAEMKSDVAIETLEVRPPRAGPTNLGDTATHEVGHRSAAPAGDAPAEIYSNNIGGGLLGVQAGQTGAENYREGGVNDTTHQRSAGIQSPRDPASGQATARNAPTSTGDQPEMTLRNTATGASANFDAPKLDADSGLEIVSPRDAASGLATGRRTYEPVVQQGNLNSAGTETANTSQWIGGSDDGSSIRRDQPAQGDNALVNNENVTEARGTATAQPGSLRQTCVMNKNCQEFESVVSNGGARGTETANTSQWAGGSDDGQSIRKPRPNKRQRKGRRMHKP